MSTAPFAFPRLRPHRQHLAAVDEYADEKADVRRVYELVRYYDKLDYSWLDSYAQKVLEATVKDSEYVDAKAEKFVAFISALAGVVVTLTGHVVAVGPWAWLVPASTIPAIGFMAWSVTEALQAHRNQKQYDLPDVALPISIMARMAQQDDAADAQQIAVRARAEFLVELHKARKYQTKVLNAKGEHLEKAQAHLVRAIWALLLPLVTMAAVAGHLH